MIKVPMPKNKRKFTLWIYLETIKEIKQLYDEDNCRSKSEFIEKAVLLHINHITAENDRYMLTSAILSSIKSIVAESDDRLSRLLFKLAVDIAVTMNVAVANRNIDDASLERLKGECVKEVKRMNGSA